MALTKLSGMTYFKNSCGTRVEHLCSEGPDFLRMQVRERRTSVPGLLSGSLLRAPASGEERQETCLRVECWEGKTEGFLGSGSDSPFWQGEVAPVVSVAHVGGSSSFYSLGDLLSLKYKNVESQCQAERPCVWPSWPPWPMSALLWTWLWIYHNFLRPLELLPLIIPLSPLPHPHIAVPRPQH